MSCVSLTCHEYHHRPAQPVVVLMTMTSFLKTCLHLSNCLLENPAGIWYVQLEGWKKTWGKKKRKEPDNKIPWLNWSEPWFQCRRSHRWCCRWLVSCGSCHRSRRPPPVRCCWWSLDCKCHYSVRLLTLQRCAVGPLPPPSHMSEVNRAFLKNMRACLRTVHTKSKEQFSDKWLLYGFNFVHTW